MTEVQHRTIKDLRFVHAGRYLLAMRGGELLESLIVDRVLLDLASRPARVARVFPGQAVADAGGGRVAWSNSTQRRLSLLTSLYERSWYVVTPRVVLLDLATLRERDVARPWWSFWCDPVTFSPDGGWLAVRVTNLRGVRPDPALPDGREGSGLLARRRQGDVLARRPVGRHLGARRRPGL